MYALYVLGALLGTWAIGEAFDVWNSDDTSEDEENPNETPVDLTGTDGINDLLSGTEGDDTLTGNPEEADTLMGGAGDDMLILSADNIATGSEGDDTFQAFRDAVIEDFTPGEDHLEIVNFTDSSYEDLSDSYFWRTTPDGVGLYSAYETTGPVSQVAFLSGLTTPPPVEDITEVRIDDRLGATTRVTGDDINFTQEFTGTDGDDSLTMDDSHTNWTADMGDGNDTVSFASLRANTDLGDGNDVYTSTDSISEPLSQPDIARGGAGDDTFTPGQLRNSVFEGDEGNDIFNLINYSDSGFVEADGGAGDDNFLLGMNAVVTGGEGADTFTVLNQYVSAEITDFNPDEDVIAVTLPPDYAGAGDITLRNNANDTTTLQVDGQSYATLAGTITQTTGIVTVSATTA